MVSGAYFIIMKTKRLFATKYNLLFAATFVLLSTLTVNRASAQIDHYYGLNNSGFRISAGVGIATEMTHYSSNPGQLAAIGSLDYDFNPYLSIGLQAQAGNLKGVDAVNHLYYSSSKNQYLDANINMRVALGEFDDFEALNAFQDAVKRIYFGLGIGRIRTDVTFTHNGTNPSPAPESVEPIVQAWSFPLNIGTNIDLHGALGIDRLSLNPNFQFNYVNSYYLDGYRTSVTFSHLKGFYNLTSLSLKYKF